MVGLQLRAGKTSFNNMSPIVRAMRQQAQPNLLAFADKVGQNGKRIILSKIQAIYNTSRPTSRRRYPGSMRLGSGAMFDYKVIPYSSGDAATQFLVKGGEAEKKKFMALNFGAGAHDIGPLKGAGLAFPKGDGGQAISTGKGDPLDKVFITGGRGREGHVRWKPGSKIGTHFYEKAIAEARRTTRP